MKETRTYEDTLKETRTYEITGYPEHLDILESVLGQIEVLGNLGCSRTIQLHIDGDGSVKLKVRRNGQPVEIKEYINSERGFIKAGIGNSIIVDLW